MGGGGGTTTQYVKSETSNLPEYAKPYFQSLMGGAQGLLGQDYTPFPGQRVADFTPEQRQVQQDVLSQQTPGQFGAATGLATAAGLGSLFAGQYQPGQFGAQQVRGQQATSPQMQAAQTGFSPQLDYFQMGPAREVSGFNINAPQMQGAQTGYGQGELEQYRMDAPEIFGQPQAEQYMSPYMSNVLDVQKREAIRNAQQGQLVQDLGAARQGTYGGSRQLLAGMERERNLGQQLGDIDARGMQAAFENAQQQFERDRAAGMTAGQQNLQASLQQQQLGVQTGLQTALANLSADQQARVNNQAAQLQASGMNADQALRAALANQGVDVTRGQQNLAAQLQTQQLGTQTGLQSALANLDAQSQANVQNLAAQLQTQGLNSEQAMRAALANQQAGLEAQRLGEQSRQFGSQQQLAGLGQAAQIGQTLSNIGQMQQQADLSRLNQQQQTAAQEQAMQQQYLDTAYQDFLRQRDFPLEMLQQYSSLLRGVPVTPQSTTTTYAPNPGIAQQLLGTGLGVASLSNLVGGTR
jgi:hypothetical protein